MFFKCCLFLEEENVVCGADHHQNPMTCVRMSIPPKACKEVEDSHKQIWLDLFLSQGCHATVTLGITEL